MRLADQEAFEAEMLPYLQAAYRLARALTGTHQDAEDLVQETYLRAFKGFGGYRRNTNARAWLLKILRRVYLNNRRHEKAGPVIFPLVQEDRTIDVPDTQAYTPEEQALRTIDAQHVLRALSELPEPYRATLALVDLDGMRYGEAAAILNCPIGTVMSRLHRGRRELARLLQITRAGLEAG
jgi:RNA polymerase sigma-70 factor (ECF subfamily)